MAQSNYVGVFIAAVGYPIGFAFRDAKGSCRHS